jgi:hypothetical protein
MTQNKKVPLDEEGRNDKQQKKDTNKTANSMV